MIMIPSIKFMSVVLDCKDPSKLAEFYANLLGGKANDVMEHFSIVTIPDGKYYLSCQLNEDYAPPVWPGSPEEQSQMEHLDFSVEDMEASVQYALSLGATKPSVQYWQPGWGPRWVTLLDPAGHPFCLCDKEE
jgi:uncharacterized glyoxalase superfamily protein PhnB